MINITDNQKDMNFNKLNFLLKKLSLEFPIAELSRKTGYKEGTISPYVNGKIKPSSKFLQSIMDNFEITLGRFLWFYFKSKPSDKYHNDSWRNRKNKAD